MSDDLIQNEIDRRPHRCRPPRAKAKGATWACDCGVVYQFVGTQFGWQWLPRTTVDDETVPPPTVLPHRLTNRTALRGVVP